MITYKRLLYNCDYIQFGAADFGFDLRLNRIAFQRAHRSQGNKFSAPCRAVDRGRVLECPGQYIRRVVANKENRYGHTAKQILVSVLVAVIVAALGALWLWWQGFSVYHVVLADRLKWDWEHAQSAVARMGAYTSDKDLGKHDICQIYNVAMQKNQNSWSQCKLQQGSEHVWSIRAEVQSGGPEDGRQVICEAVCADFR